MNGTSAPSCFSTRLPDDRLRSRSDFRRRTGKEPTSTADGTVRLAPGQSVAGVRLAYLGKMGIILADYDHWLILPKPPRKR